MLVNQMPYKRPQSRPINKKLKLAHQKKQPPTLISYYKILPRLVFLQFEKLTGLPSHHIILLRGLQRHVNASQDTKIPLRSEVTFPEVCKT